MKCPVALNGRLAGCPSFSSPPHARHCHRSCYPICALQAVSGSLGQQRTVFEGVGGKMQSLGSKFPVVNSLMNAIRRRKNRVGALQLAGCCSCSGRIKAGRSWSGIACGFGLRLLATCCTPHSCSCPLGHLPALRLRTT